MLFCLANPFAQRHPLSARVLTEKFSFPHSSFLPCSLALLSPFGCECTAAFILTDSDLARGHWHYCLSACWDLDVYPSAVTWWSVVIPSDFIATCLWFESLFLICIFPSPSSKLSKSSPSKKLLLTTGSAGKLMQVHRHLKIVGARTIAHSPC